jgi:hypothetical protein
MAPLQPQHPSSLDPMREVQEIINAYNPHHPDYRFRTYFYNVIKDPRYRVKPQNVSERKWRDLLEAVGGENNPQCLWPVQYDGFEGLLRRKAEAEAEDKAQSQFLDAAQSSIRQIIQWSETECRKRMEGIKNRSLEHQHRLIKIFRHLNRAQLKMYADANGGAVPPMSAQEIDLLNKFKTLSSRVNRSAASLPRRAEALAAASRLQHSVAPADEIILSDDDKARFMDIIERQGKDIEELERKIDERYKHVARLPTASAFVSAADAVTTASSAPSSKSLLFDQSVLSRY